MGSFFFFFNTNSIPAALNSLYFCSNADFLASSIYLSLASRLAFFPLVFANLTLASASICFISYQKIKSFLLTFIHINRIRLSWFNLWRGIDLARFQLPRVIFIIDILPLRLIQKLFIMLNTLCRSSPHYRRYRAPLTRKYL